MTFQDRSAAKELSRWLLRSSFGFCELIVYVLSTFSGERTPGSTVEHIDPKSSMQRKSRQKVT